ncbi:hypothetical protein FRB96_008831 [Tulasnella sp. 330]|nr:hypothetical protein FRB96_008831 [Tulasnella sp. 330]KAG8882306.1 hypothetical protein FRB97_008414 [Tulasnella sp. 331]KAG8888256.1 hypothetical protein FRB98_008090 [Tulasnella sp. 332]
MNTSDVCYVTTSAAVWSNSTIEAAYCAANDFPYCLGLCPNTDLAGIGVRLAFYLQAAMNALLMVMCPEDAAAGAWASTVLTAALIIPAIIQKAQQNITLHHSVLVLNFATLSCVASLASAPLVPIWRGMKRPDETNEEFAQEQLERTQGRKVLSFAILVQIILQWTWTVLLFVDPYYNQTPCSGSTVIVFFFGAYTADDINEKHFALWAVWLLMTVCMSLVWGAALVLTCTSPVHDERPDLRHMQTKDGATRFWRTFVLRLPDLTIKVDRYYWMRWLIRISTVSATLVVLMYIIMSETQIKKNVVLSGESNFWTFSQSAAVLLALTPIWPIAIATTKKYPKLPQHMKQVTSPRPKVSPAGSSFSPDLGSSKWFSRFSPRSSSSTQHKSSTFDLKLPNEPVSMHQTTTSSLDIHRALPALPLGLTGHDRIPSLGDPWSVPAGSAPVEGSDSQEEKDETDTLMPLKTSAFPLRRMAAGLESRPKSGSYSSSSTVTDRDL